MAAKKTTKRTKLTAAQKKRVSLKTSKLISDEKIPPKQAYAMATSMERAGRLGAKGGYKRKKKARK